MGLEEEWEFEQEKEEEPLGDDDADGNRGFW